MPEFELVEILNGVSSNIIANQAVFVTILTAYLVVAYSVGNKLTTYQVAFINVIFIVFALIGIQSIGGLLNVLSLYSTQLMELRGIMESEYRLKLDAVRWGMISIRYIICIGALVFMWQVRHPKTE